MARITQLMRRAVQTRPDAVASECDGRVRTWREFEGRVIALAAAMASLGLRPGDRVAVLALNSDRYLEFFFAAAWGGFTFVPINTRLAPPELVFWPYALRAAKPGQTMAARAIARREFLIWTSPKEAAKSVCVF